MPEIKLTMIGGNWKGEEKVQLLVDKESPFDSQIDKFTEKMKVTEGDLKSKWALHPYVDGKVAPTPISFSEGQTPASVGLIKAVNMISIKPAGGAPPPPAGTRPKTAGTAKGAPPPPPKKGSASPSKGAPPPPPPKKGSASPSAASKGAPPPPPKKGGTTPVKSSSSPPPPPKKTGAPPGFSPAGKTVQGKSAPPPQPKKTKGPPPPKPTPQATFDTDMLGGDTSDDDGGGSSGDDGGTTRPSFNANAGFKMDAGMMGGDDDSDANSGDGSSDEGAGGGGAPPTGSTTMKIPMFNPNDSDEETPADNKKPAAPPPPPARKTKQPVASQPRHLGAPPPQPKAGSRSVSPMPQQKQPPARVGTKSPGPAQSTAKHTNHKELDHPPSVAGRSQQQPHARVGTKSPHAPSPENQAVHSGVYLGGAGAMSAAQVQETLYEAAKTKVELTHLAAKMDEKVTQLQKTVGEDDKERMDKMQTEMLSTVQREMSQIRDSMSNNYETQRASVLKQQVELEEKRRAMMENLVERERKLHNAQTEMLTNFQHRVNAQASGGSAAIEELKLSNAALREQLADVQRRKKLMSDNSLNQVMQLQAQIADAMSGVQRTASIANTTAVRQSASPIRERGQSMLGAAAGGTSGGAATMNGGATILRQQELHNFLASIGLEKYVPALMVHEVDVSALTQMSDLDLEAVGISTVGARRRIQAECQRRGVGGQVPRGHNETSFQSSGGAAPFGLSPHPLNPSSGAGVPSSPLAQRQGTTNSFAGGMMSPQQSIAQFSTTAGSTMSGIAPYGALSRNEQIAHHELLEDFLDNMEDDVIFDRIPSILDTFGGNLADMYQALCYRYKVQRSPFRGPILHFLKQNPQFVHLAPAVDVICEVHRTREAEFCELLMVKHLGINKQAHVWVAYQRYDEDAHEPSFRAAKRKAAEEAKAARQREREENGGDSDEEEQEDEVDAFATEECPIFFHNALVNMSQWSRPKGLEAPGAVKVVHEMHYPSQVTDKDKRQWPGGGQGRTNLEPNPTSPSMARSQVHRITASAVALLMKHEPARLAEGPALFARYKGREHHLLYNLQQLYGDHGMSGSSSALSPPPTPAGLN